jgi:NAD(P)-dependent dehydrogenase (short-subunit alcohol dehydrogenase family)
MNTNSNPMPIVVTGATGSIGREIARALAAEGHSLILACRNESKCNELIDALHREFPHAEMSYLHLDLSDSKSVDAAVAQLAGIELQGLINNAGIMCRHYSLSADGHEMTLTVNYHNTRRLTESLLPQIKGFVVFTTSMTRRLWSKQHLSEDVNEQSFSQLTTYGLSKRLITNYAEELSARAGTVRVNCADPGVVNTDMIRMDRWFDRLADKVFRPFIRTPRKGATPALRAAHAADTGFIYYLRTQEKM